MQLTEINKNMLGQDKKYDPVYVQELKSHLRRGDMSEIAKRIDSDVYYVSQVLSGNRGRAIKSQKGLQIIEHAKDIVVKRTTLVIATGAKLNYSILNNFN